MLKSLLNSTDTYMYNNHQRILINGKYFEEIITNITLLQCTIIITILILKQ